MQEARRCSVRPWGSTLPVRRIPSPSGCSRPRLAEFEDELIGVAADGRIEHLRGVRIVLVAQDVAPGFEPEACGHDFLLHRLRIDAMQRRGVAEARAGLRDRKSTRLNSSHSQISYAVFCLKQ